MTVDTSQATSVKTAMTVEAPIERAFEVFTAGIGTWWPPDHHILEAELQEMVFEPRVGGAIIDRGDGWEQMRDSVSSGWSLQPFADALGRGA